MHSRIETNADRVVHDCITKGQSFALIAGAGSGKTASLIDALALIRQYVGAELRLNGQRIACITYTDRATDVIRSRLGNDELYVVSTLHGFLWKEIGSFHEDIRESLLNTRVPARIEAARAKDKGGDTKAERQARERAAQLEADFNALATVTEFVYGADSAESTYAEGKLSHDDVVEVASDLLARSEAFRRIIGMRFPYIMVDEAQDTFKGIVHGLNLTCPGRGLPLVGYFGDPWQQIYDDRAADFSPPAGGRLITKTENFRSSRSVIDLLNAFRSDVEQYPAGSNKDRQGSVEFCLIQAEKPELPRGKYSDEQSERAHARMERVLRERGWQDHTDVMRLFLARQMIARRLGFPDLNKLFTGVYASKRAQGDYEKGKHFLLEPFINVLCPLVAAHREHQDTLVIELLRKNSPSFAIDGPNSDKTLSEVVMYAQELLSELDGIWSTGKIHDILRFCEDRMLLRISTRLHDHLHRDARHEVYAEDLHQREKGDWLCDAFFAMQTSQLPAYCKFVSENSAYSTQHGVKGEEYPNVLVVYDDTEAAWTEYSFTKLLTPKTAGKEPTEGQADRGRKLAYVCFSRALDHLKVILFTMNPHAAQQELVERGLLRNDQISVWA